MNDREASSGVPPDHGPDGFIERLRRWWKSGDMDERYLAAASDLADLERRQRVLERASRGPAIETFNH